MARFSCILLLNYKMAYSSHRSYRRSVRQALDDDFLHAVLENFTKSYPASRSEAFSGKDIQSLVNEIAEIKKRSISKLDELFSQFKRKAEELGIIVQIAQTAEEACRIIEKIAEENDVKSIIKSKSMTSEEVHLNGYLESKGFEVIESDLGEWIIQLRHEGPSHMVMPAIHLSRTQVANLFSEVTAKAQNEDISTLVKVARKELRGKFINADMGITGANFAIAETGTIGLITNEGNARFVTTLPKVHVALIGLEKLVENIDDALKIIEVLPKNATGQKISSYVTWITGRSECTVSDTAKKKYHIVFLDNGRTVLAKDRIFSEILHCIRCGACANVCPVYGHIGGHKMGHIYIGPVGLVLTYFYHGLNNARFLADNCINCLACKEVCASGIDLPSLIKEVQIRIHETEGQPFLTKAAGKLLRNRKLFHRFLKIAKAGQKPFTSKDGFMRHLPLMLYRDHSFRSLPNLVSEPLRDRWGRIKPEIEDPVLKVGLFAGCLNDFVYPEQVESAVNLLADNNIETIFPEEQSCCGLPLMMMGDTKNTRMIAMQNVKAFEGGNYDFIITLCASCASFLRESYPGIVGLNENEITRVTGFSKKIVDFRSFVRANIKLSKKEKNNKVVTYHSPCHLARGLNIKMNPEDLITSAGYDFKKADHENSCCGFGGTYTLKFPEISEAQLNKKLNAIVSTGAEILVTECPGCIMQLRGGADRAKMKLQVLHLSEILNPANK